MRWYTLSIEDVVLIHEAVINPQELQGMARDKSLDGALSRVDHRIHYGMVNDLYDLAATYAVVIATGHVFNDANKRTAYQVMRTCLDINGIEVDFDSEDIGGQIIKAAKGQLDETELAMWLRRLR